jgi:hypothetical protein
MKWFWPALAIAVFFILDSLYADGRGADALLGLVRTIGLSIVHWSDDLLRPLRR